MKAAIAVTVLIVAGMAWFHAAPPSVDWTTPQPATISAKPFSTLARRGVDEPELGSWGFAGGLELRSDSPHFGALSGLRIGRDGQLLAVTDTGFWFKGRVRHEDTGAPVAMESGTTAPLLDERGIPFPEKWFGDAEALTGDGAAWYVATEQFARILRYDADAPLTSASSRYGGPVPPPALSDNRGIESLATFPATHSEAGKLLAIVEQGEGDTTRAFLWSDKSVAELTIRTRDGFAITDADFLTDGDLLLLERRFSVSNGQAMRLRRIEGGDIKAGAMLDGTVEFTLDRRYRIDNMEGLSVFTAPDGSERIGLVSDDNRWPLQRTLYLEFAQ